MSVRTAIVGYGLGGRLFHAPFVAADPDLDLVAVVTGDPERSAAARAEHRASARQRRQVGGVDPHRGILPEPIGY